MGRIVGLVSARQACRWSERPLRTGERVGYGVMDLVFNNCRWLLRSRKYIESPRERIWGRNGDRAFLGNTPPQR